MPPRLRLFATLYAVCGLAAVGCAAATDAPSVEFGSSQPIGSWLQEQPQGAPDAGAQLGGEAPAGSVVGKTQPPAAGHSAPIAPIGTGFGVGGALATPLQAGGAGGATAADSGGSGVADMAGASAGGSPDAPSPTAELTTLSFQVTTSPAGGRYQPRNVGAIWVEDDSGKLVKSLQVWAATRRRYLTGYAGALAGSSIDVTASATLSRHQTHNVTWDLKDRSGASVPQGAYRLRMELTDGNQTGKSHTVDFDTSMGPVTLTPADAPCFGAMKLELH